MGKKKNERKGVFYFGGGFFFRFLRFSETLNRRVCKKTSDEEVEFCFRFPFLFGPAPGTDEDGNEGLPRLGST